MTISAGTSSSGSLNSPFSTRFRAFPDVTAAFLIFTSGVSASSDARFNPPVDVAKPLAQASAITLVINLMDLIASSFPGIM